MYIFILKFPLGEISHNQYKIQYDKKTIFKNILLIVSDYFIVIYLFRRCKYVDYCRRLWESSCRSFSKELFSGWKSSNVPRDAIVRKHHNLSEPGVKSNKRKANIFRPRYLRARYNAGINILADNF